MDNLHRVLYEKLEEADREMRMKDMVQKNQCEQIDELNKTVEDLTDQLNKITTECNGLYDDLDAKDEESETHIARIQVLEEELAKQRKFDNPEPDEAYPIADDDMVLACDVSMKA